jgi:diguanylate cyclase (GGDEF)-like protein
MNELYQSHLHGLLARWRTFRAHFRWAHWSHLLAYALPLTPFLTDLDETGHLPGTLREWTTEIIVGMLIAVLVRRIHKDYLRAQSVAHTDALTGLGNRRAFEKALEDEAVRSVRLAQTLCLVYIDLNKFKAINDRYGHAAGDQVLLQVGTLISKVIRSHVDLGFRLGGDEFAMLLPGSTLAEAEAVVRRIRERCLHVGPGAALELSAGACQLRANETVAGFVRRADAAMYADKHAANADDRC